MKRHRRKRPDWLKCLHRLRAAVLRMRILATTLNMLSPSAGGVASPTGEHSIDGYDQQKTRGKSEWRDACIRRAGVRNHRVSASSSIAHVAIVPIASCPHPAPRNEIIKEISLPSQASSVFATVENRRRRHNIWYRGHEPMKCVAGYEIWPYPSSEEIYRPYASARPTTSSPRPAAEKKAFS